MDDMRHDQPEHQNNDNWFEAESRPTEQDNADQGKAFSPREAAFASAPMTAFSGSGANNTRGGRFDWLLCAKAYLPEYLLTLLLLVGFLASLISLLDVGLTHVLSSQSDNGDSEYSYFVDTSSLQLISSIAGLLVSLPLLLFFYFRTRSVEKSEPAVLQHRWRKAFLGGFIVVEVLAIICTLFGMAFSLVARLVDTPGVMNFLSSEESREPWWLIVVTSLVAVIILSYAIYVASQDYKRGQ